MSFISILEITTTLPTHEAAVEIATAILDQRLAACIQITGPITSIYRWKDAVHQDREFSLKIKTSLDQKDALLVYLKNHHPYELPEISLQRVDASQEYADWVHRETRIP